MILFYFISGFGRFTSRRYNASAQDMDDLCMQLSSLYSIEHYLNEK